MNASKKEFNTLFFINLGYGNSGGYNNSASVANNSSSSSSDVMGKYKLMI